MKVPWSLRTTQAAACLAGAFSALAQIDESELALDRNRLSIGARFSFGVSARVTNFSTGAPAAPDYHNGFVRPDISGNADGKTWYWGYETGDQIGGDVLNLSSALEVPSDGHFGESDDGFQGGFEILYARELGRFQLGKRRALWGVEGGVTSLNTLLETSDTYEGNVRVRTDSYRLGGIVPPGAPYQGSFEGPGPLIESSPFAQSTTDVQAVSRVDTQIETLLVGLKVGPFLDIPVTRRVHFHLSGGGVLLAAISDFSFTESASVPGLPAGALRREDSTSETQIVGGAYVQAAGSYAMTEFLSVYLGGQYQYVGDVSFGTGGKEATVEFGKAIELVFGVRASF
ncbi:MAG: hypothetical protein M5U12_14125 [Verrucomicrobia bacterium]|nr:hypothetical protein [Verrucomicrobiota bacterium]